MRGFAVNVVNGGQAAFDALVYQQPDQRLLEYMHNNMQNVLNTTANLSNTFTTTVKNMYDKFNSSAAIAAGKSILHKVGAHFNQNVVYPIREDNIFEANLIMRQYIMANPMVNRLYEQNRCYGFPDTYINPEPNVFGTDRADYQQVMTGVLQFENEGDDGYIMHYSNGMEQDDLDYMDKMSILDTWDTVTNLIARGIDPTDPDGDPL